MQGKWRSRVEIWKKGQPLWIDRQSVSGNTIIVNSPNGLRGKAMVATFLWIGTAVDPEIITKVRALGKSLVTEGEIGITQTQEAGLLCRYRGNSTAEVKQYFEVIWGLLRQTYRHRSPVRPRVWIA